MNNHLNKFLSVPVNQLPVNQLLPELIAGTDTECTLTTLLAYSRQFLKVYLSTR